MVHVTRIIIVSLLLAIVLSVPRPSPAQDESREDEVRAAVSAFARAFVEADVALLRTILTADYIHINGRTGNLLNRDEWLKWMTSREAALKKGDLEITTYTIEDLDVQVFGEAAVVTGIAYSSGKRNGDIFTSRVRFTNVWVYQGDVWRRAAFHDSPVAESSQ